MAARRQTAVPSRHFDTKAAFRNCPVGTYAAEEGELGTWCSRHRITYTVAATSLGRVRALFR